MLVPDAQPKAPSGAAGPHLARDLPQALGRKNLHFIEARELDPLLIQSDLPSSRLSKKNSGIADLKGRLRLSLLPLLDLQRQPDSCAKAVLELARLQPRPLAIIDRQPLTDDP